MLHRHQVAICDYEINLLIKIQSVSGIRYILNISLPPLVMLEYHSLGPWGELELLIQARPNSEREERIN